jgi:hypothetical protein
MVNNILNVGSSILINGNASGLSKSAMVSPISKPSIPVTAQISPAFTSAAFTFPKPTKVYNSLSVSKSLNLTTFKLLLQ